MKYKNSINNEWDFEEMIGKTIANRYRIDAEINHNYLSYSNQQITEFNGYDLLHKRNIRIKFFDLPLKENIKQLAIALWEREIRLIRKSLNFKGGEVLLKILDAAIDEIENKLYIVYPNFGKTLEEWEKDSDGIWFFGELDQKERKEIWLLFEDLLVGLDILHQSKLLHRNINPSTILYSEQSDGSNLRLGDLTWSLYLHNLSFIPSKEITTGRTTIFKIPYNLIDIKGKKSDNIFAEDIFSIGMVLVYIFLTNFPNNVIFENIDDWKKIYEKISADLISLQSLKPNEKELLLNIISIEHSKRPKSVFDLKQKIRLIINSFEENDKEIDVPLRVSWYNSIESYFFRDISHHIDISIDEIIENPNQWLEDEFVNAKIYATGIEKYPLVILSNKEELFSVHPIQDRYNNREQKDVLELKMVWTRERSRIYQSIKSKSFLAILRKGMIFADNRFERDPLSKWNILYSKALSELSRIKDDSTPISNFINGLNVMLTAEKEIDIQKMLSYKKLESKRIPTNNIERAKIVVSSDFKEAMNERQKLQIRDQLFDFLNKNGGSIELSMDNDPSSSWNNHREWRIIRIIPGNLECVIEREIKGKNKKIDEEGVIRPFEMNLSVSLYRRKERLIENLKNNNSMLDSILNPKSSTFYMGYEKNQTNPILSHILNTIPMYLVQGPPGTGKTWVASSLIARIIESNPYSRILVASKDHEPLDYLVEAVHEKLQNLEFDENNYPIIVRAMSTEREQEYTPSDLVFQYSSQNKIKEILAKSGERINQIDLLPKELKKEWISIIKNNISNLSIKWSDEIQKVANIVFATATSSTVEWLSRESAPYDWIIIEEAAKAYPLELLLPMSLGHRWLLIGDQKQLPPFKYNEILIKVGDLIDDIQKNEERDTEEYMKIREEILNNIKFFEKLFTEFKTIPVLYSESRYNPCYQLTKQWRMPPLIANMIGEIFYDSAFESMKPNPDIGDPFISPEILANNILLWIDIPHMIEDNIFTDKKDKMGSTYNIQEAKIIVELIQSMKFNSRYEKGEFEDLVILTPYIAQKNEIKKQILQNSFEVYNSKELARKCYTIDSYQGKQAEVVIISLVRNNSFENIRSALGFLIKNERLNVMFSRARKRMIIIGSSKNIVRFKNDTECKSMIKILDYIESNGLIVKFDNLNGGE